MLCVPLVRGAFLFDSFHVLEIVDLCLRIMSQITQNVLLHGAKTPSNPLKQHVAACLGCSGRSFPELPLAAILEVRWTQVNVEPGTQKVRLSTPQEQNTLEGLFTEVYLERIIRVIATRRRVQ